MNRSRKEDGCNSLGATMPSRTAAAKEHFATSSRLCWCSAVSVRGGPSRWAGGAGERALMVFSSNEAVVIDSERKELPLSIQGQAVAGIFGNSAGLTRVKPKAAIAARPTPRLLEAGAYFERPSLVEALYESFFTWITEADSDARVPVLMIVGRGGTGKSVLLSMLMYELTALHGDELDLDFIESGEAFIRTIQAGMTRAAPDRKQVFLVDDIHKGVDVLALARVAEQLGNLMVAIVSTCQTEDLAVFSSDFAAYFAVTPIQFDDLNAPHQAFMSPDDVARAARHFEIDVDAEDASVATEATALEWCMSHAGGENPIGIADRLVRLVGRESLVCEMLAMASIDLDYPLSLVPPECAGSVKRALADGQFLFPLGEGDRVAVSLRYRQEARSVLAALGKSEDNRRAWLLDCLAQLAESYSAAAPSAQDIAAATGLVDRLLVRSGELGWTGPAAAARKLLGDKRFSHPKLAERISLRAAHLLDPQDAQFADFISTLLAAEGVGLEVKASLAARLVLSAPDTELHWETMRALLKDDSAGQGGIALVWLLSSPEIISAVKARALTLTFEWLSLAQGKTPLKPWLINSLLGSWKDLSPTDFDPDGRVYRVLQPYLAGELWTKMEGGVLAQIMKWADPRDAVLLALEWLKANPRSKTAPTVIGQAGTRLGSLGQGSAERQQLLEFALAILGRLDARIDVRNWQFLAGILIRDLPPESPDRQILAERLGEFIGEPAYAGFVDSIIAGIGELTFAIPLLRAHVTALRERDFAECTRVLAKLWRHLEVLDETEIGIFEELAARSRNQDDPDQAALLLNLSSICMLHQHADLTFDVGADLVALQSAARAKSFMAGRLLSQAAHRQLDVRTSDRHAVILSMARRIARHRMGQEALIGMADYAAAGFIEWAEVANSVRNLFYDVTSPNQPGRALQAWIRKSDGSELSIDFLLKAWTDQRHIDELAYAAARAQDPVLAAMNSRQGDVEQLADMLIMGLDHERAPNAREALAARRDSWPDRLAARFEAAISIAQPVSLRNWVDSSKLAMIARKRGYQFRTWEIAAGIRRPLDEVRNAIETALDGEAMAQVEIHDPYALSATERNGTYNANRIRNVLQFVPQVLGSWPAQISFEHYPNAQDNSGHTRRLKEDIKKGCAATIVFVPLSENFHRRWVVIRTASNREIRLKMDHGIDAFFRTGAKSDMEVRLEW